MKKTLDLVSHVISYVFNPLWMPVGTLFILFRYNTLFRLTIQPPVQNAVLMVAVFFSVVMPVAMILLLRRYKMVQAVNLPSSFERRIPLLLSSIFYSFAYFTVRRMSYELDLTPYLSFVFLAGLLGLVVATTVNLWYKISIHMLAVGSLVGVLTAFADYRNYYNFELLTGSILLAGLVGSARLQLKAHTPGQVVLGFLAGFLTQYGVLMLFRMA